MKNVFFNYHKGLVKTITIALISYLLIQSPFLFALDKIYWVNQRDKKIQRSDFNGSNMESIITTGMDRPYGIAIDKVKGKIYWTDWGLDKITMSNLDGSGITTIVSTGLKTPLHIEVDPLGGKIYWVDSESKTVHRANLDGSNRETIVSGLNSSPIGIDLDLINGKIYWSAYGPGTAEGVIQRANLNGTNVENVTSAIDPNGLALDIAHNKIYWINGGFVSGGYYVPAPEIWWCDLNGSNKRKLLSQGTGSTFLPTDLATDSDGGKIYWTESVSKGWESGFEKIMRANLNGSNVEALITDIPGDPTPIGIDLLLGYTPGNLVADFSATPTSGTAPLTVQFTDQSTGNITSRSWNFGDGQTSTATNPSHIYQNAGTYTVKLTVAGPGGSNTKTRSSYISVSSSPAPVANFSGTPTSGTAPLIVQFTDQSTGNITSRSWDFGDGQTSTATNPSHTYQNAGTYTVKLTVTGTGGSNTKTRTNYIIVSSPSTPVANFSGTPTSGTAPLAVQFTDHSTGSITNRSWDFGDGQTSTATNPTHVYQNTGTYSVKLTVTNNGGSDSEIRYNYIDVFTEGKNLVEDPEFDYGWNYWGGYVDPRDADYNITFDKNSVLSGQNSLKVDIKKAGSLDWYITMFTNLAIRQNSYYEIRFKAKLIGTTTKDLHIRFQQGQDPWKDYGGKIVTINNTTEDYGPFYIQANTTDPVARFNFHFGGGGTDNILIYIDKVYVSEYTPGPPIPQFTATPLSGEAPLTVNFTDESSGFIYRRKWDFGDGKSSVAVNPGHKYENPGIYDVSLTLIGVSGDTVNFKKDKYITVGSTNVESANTNNKSLSSFFLEQNYPNPFNSDTKIGFNLPIASDVIVQIYNLHGESVAHLFKGKLQAGFHSINWNAVNFQTGTYIIRVLVNEDVLTRKCVLLK